MILFSVQRRQANESFEISVAILSRWLIGKIN